MRRDELIKGAENAIDSLIRTKVVDLIEAATGPPRSGNTKSDLALVIDCYAKFMKAYDTFGPVEKEFLRIFELELLVHPDFWQDLIRTENTATLTDRLMQARRSIYWLTNTVPKILPLLRRSSETRDIIIAEPAKKGKSKTVTTQRLTFFIRETETPNLTVEQFVHVLGSVQNLYNIILRVHSMESAELVVGSLDSGSEKSIDILGVAGAIAKLSELLLEIWSKVRFARPEKVSAAIKTASDGITLISQIGSANQKGEISSEEAEKLRRTIIKSIEELFANGVYTKEMESKSALDIKSIPVERRKLIAYYATEGRSADDDEGKGGQIAHNKDAD